VTGAAVQFPEMRARLSAAVASLRDPTLQNRLWRRGERLNDQELGFDDTVLVVIDELDWPTPDELVGCVLRDDTELAAFQRLSAAVDELLLAIGELGTFQDAVAMGAPWQKVLAAADALEALLIRYPRTSGGIPERWRRLCFCRAWYRRVWCAGKSGRQRRRTPAGHADCFPPNP
jgi:hypothetical protein